MKNKLPIFIFAAVAATFAISFFFVNPKTDIFLTPAKAATIGNLTMSVVSTSVPIFLREGDMAENTVMTVRVTASAATNITSLNFSTFGASGYGAEIISASLYDGTTKLGIMDNALNPDAPQARQKDVVFAGLNLGLATGASKDLTVKVKLAPAIQNRAYCVLWLNRVGLSGGSELAFTNYDIVAVVPIVKSYATEASLFLPVISYSYNNEDAAVFKDVSGNNVDFACQGRNDTCPKIVKGQDGIPDKQAFALLFDGDNDFISSTKQMVSQDQTTLTVEAWFKPDHPVTWKKPDGINATLPPRLTLISQQGAFRLEMYTSGFMSLGIFLPSGEVNATFNTQPVYNSYNHVVAVMENSKVKMYFNGVYLAEKSLLNFNKQVVTNVKINASTYPIEIGKMFNQHNYYFKGVIDELYVYPRALTASEASSRYQELAVNLPEIPVNMKFSEPFGSLLFGSGGDLVEPATCVGVKCPVAGFAGRSGLAARFDGVDDYISIPTSGSISLRNLYSILVWYKPESKVDYIAKWGGNFVSKYSSYTFGIWNYRDKRLTASVWTPVGRQTISTPAKVYANGVWNQAALTYDGFDLKIYSNGIEVASKPMSYSPNATISPLNIGSYIEDGQYFKGSVDKLVLMNRAMSAAEISEDYKKLQPSKLELDGAVYDQSAYYRFDEPANSVLFYDMLGKMESLFCFNVNNNTGGMLYSTKGCPARTTGVKDGAIKFDGSNTYLLADASITFAPKNAMSFGFWIKPEPTAANGAKSQQIIFKLNSFAASMPLPASSGKLSALIRTSNGDKVVSSGVGALTANKWHHVFVVYNGFEVKLFINGVKVAATPASGEINLTASSMFVGATSATAGAANFSGSLDELEIFGRALTDSEVLAKYNQLKP